MFDEMRPAMNFEHLRVGHVDVVGITFLRRIAMRVSRSGGWMSVISPHSKRERSRSSSVEISRGGRSDEITIWPPAS
jgi:hypothetical protein